MTMRNALPAIIETERLTLRAPADSDLADIVALANNPRMLATTATLPHPFGEADGLAFLADAKAGTSMLAYAIVAGDDRFMGAILLKFADDTPPEIGYWLGEPHWGQGYAGEAVAGLVSAGERAGLVRIDARVLESNPASIRVLEKAGFMTVERTTGRVERHRGKPLLIMQWNAR